MRRMTNCLAVLMALAASMAAVLFTSCDKNDLETNKEVTVTIAPDIGSYAFNHDSDIDISSISLETGEVVNLYKVYNQAGWKSIEVPFTCIDPDKGTFAGTLPEGVESVDELNLALYHCSINPEKPIEDGEVVVDFLTKASKDLKDVIAMAAVKDDGKFTMKAVNNIVRIRNTTLKDIDAAWVVRKTFGLNFNSYYVEEMTCGANVLTGKVAFHQLPVCDVTSDNFEKCKFTLRSKTDYFLSLCPGNENDAQVITLSVHGDASVSFSKFVSSISSTGGTVYTAPEILPKGALSGVFSVNYLPARRVHFSKGNLYYTGSDWAFEGNQYDFRTLAGQAACIDGTASSSGTPSGNVGLFFWTSNTANSYTDIYKDTDSGSSFFANTDNAVKGSIWQALSEEEWSYLLNKRSDAYNKIGFATVCGVNGAILLPDTFTDPGRNASDRGPLFVSKSAATGFESNIYDGSDWDAMEAAGAVFLPTIGFRNDDKTYMVGNQGFYWTSTFYDNKVDAYGMFICGNSVDVEVNPRNGGQGVRLVTYAE